MDIELYSLLAWIILVATGATVLFAVFSYVTFRARESRSMRRAPLKAAAERSAAPKFFKRYEPIN